jgi:hypothetical protein
MFNITHPVLFFCHVWTGDTNFVLQYFFFLLIHLSPVLYVKQQHYITRNFLLIILDFLGTRSGNCPNNWHSYYSIYFLAIMWFGVRYINFLSSVHYEENLNDRYVVWISNLIM